MKFADFIRVQAIKADLVAEDKDGAIRELVAGLVESKDISEGEQESIVKAIMKREELGSTGIGRGVAVPHTKHPSVEPADWHGGRECRRVWTSTAWTARRFSCSFS